MEPQTSRMIDQIREAIFSGDIHTALILAQGRTLCLSYVYEHTKAHPKVLGCRRMEWDIRRSQGVNYGHKPRGAGVMNTDHGAGSGDGGMPESWSSMGHGLGNGLGNGAVWYEWTGDDPLEDRCGNCDAPLSNTNSDYIGNALDLEGRYAYECQKSSSITTG